MNWEQFRTILWLRWRLTRNQLTRGSGFGAVIMVLLSVMLVMGALGIGIGAICAGAFAMKNVSANVMMFVWDGVTLGVLFFCLMAVAAELQRSESVDMTRLLHLPISLKQVFVLNYLASLVSPGTVLMLAAMLGLTVGIVISNGLRFVLVALLVAAFVFMVTAWIYCLRGWLLSLMINPRRKRSIIMWLTLGIILISQTPQLINLAVQRRVRAEREARRSAQKQSPNDGAAARRAATNAREEQTQYYVAVATQIHPWVPVLWLPNGARGLAAGEFLPAAWSGAGMFALGWLGLSRAYRSTLRFYRGDEKARPLAAKPAPKKDAKPAANWIEVRLPWLPEETGALALMQLRSMTRAPEVRMMLAMGLFMSIFVPLMIVWRGGSNVNLGESVKPFIGTTMVVMVLFTLLQLVCNQFGCDRDGFRGLVLLPTSRQRLLFGKNLAVFPLAAAIAFVPLVAVSWFAKLPPLVIASTVMQFAAAFLLFCAIGNLSSILAPFRVQQGSLKPTKQKWQTVLVMLGVHFLFPVGIAPVFVPPLLGFLAERLGWLSASPVNFLASLVLATVFGAVYWFTLSPLGRLLQRRETNILRAVTEVME